MFPALSPLIIRIAHAQRARSGARSKRNAGRFPLSLVQHPRPHTTTQNAHLGPVERRHVQRQFPPRVERGEKRGQLACHPPQPALRKRERPCERKARHAIARERCARDAGCKGAAEERPRAARQVRARCKRSRGAHDTFEGREGRPACSRWKGARSAQRTCTHDNMHTRAGTETRTQQHGSHKRPAGVAVDRSHRVVDAPVVGRRVRIHDVQLAVQVVGVPAPAVPRR